MGLRKKYLSSIVSMQSLLHSHTPLLTSLNLRKVPKIIPLHLHIINLPLTLLTRLHRRYQTRIQQIQNTSTNLVQSRCNQRPMQPRHPCRVLFNSTQFFVLVKRRNSARFSERVGQFLVGRGEESPLLEGEIGRVVGDDFGHEFCHVVVLFSLVGEFGHVEAMVSWHVGILCRYGRRGH